MYDTGSSVEATHGMWHVLHLTLSTHMCGSGQWQWPVRAVSDALTLAWELGGGALRSLSLPTQHAPRPAEPVSVSVTVWCGSGSAEPMPRAALYVVGHLYL